MNLWCSKIAHPIVFDEWAMGVEGGGGNWMAGGKNFVRS